MIRILKHLFFVAGMAFIAVAFTNAYFVDQASVSNNSFITSSGSKNDIVINEILPDPDGDDNAAMPYGEWVELYNKGDWTIDVSGWQVRDADGHSMTINSDHVISSTVLSPRHWLVVYKNNMTSFSINNDDETILLFDDLNNQIDVYSYHDSILNRSYARRHDGIDDWVEDQTPTPGSSNG